MIIIDANVVKALCDPDDELSKIAIQHLGHFIGQEIVLPEAVLQEALFLMKEWYFRERLITMMRDFEIDVLLSSPPWEDVFTWLKKYQEHEPDWADAVLCVLSGMQPKSSIWTYDSEFKDIWRRPDGSHIPLAVKL